MTLTLDSGPLATDPPASTNYRIDGPPHRILVQDHPRRIRIEFAGRTVVDTTAGRLLHESNLLPVFYVPFDEVAPDVLTRTEQTTHCPFKGDATYWTVTVDDQVAEDAVWGYVGQADRVEGFVDEASRALAASLDGYVAFHLDRMDAVYEEDEQVLGHLRDPYHRVDTRASSRYVVVRFGNRVVAETHAPMAVFETGLPPRWYVPEADIDADLLESDTTTVCPYKGVATYRSMAHGPADIAFSYPDPLPEAQGLPGHWCFLGEQVTTEVDGAPAP